MEIVIVEKKTFEALLAAAESLAGKVGELCRHCSDKRANRWLDGQEVCRLMRISPRTLQTLRDNRMIAFAQVNRKFYYRPEEVERLLKEAALQQSDT
ncbi:helix-turn-helix domain-containing protein [Alistipes ihumii]|uniref:helix-turn-helix domain-containing protein n=1 Tax=Alistipes ihumii TaxID=1470347 RepID=UPI003A89C7DC